MEQSEDDDDDAEDENDEIMYKDDEHQNRIGELPRRKRTHWPWDRPRRTTTTILSKQREQPPPQKTVENPKVNNKNHHIIPVLENDQTTTKTTQQHPNHVRESQQQSWEKQERDSSTPDSAPNGHTTGEKEQPRKSDLCIGSIFGLDVGGSLGKLAYFESLEYLALDEDERHRERLYRARASAHVVCMSRRGNDSPGNNDNDHNNNGGATTAAAALHPMLRHRHSSVVDHKRHLSSSSHSQEEDPIIPTLSRRRRRRRAKSHGSAMAMWRHVYHQQEEEEETEEATTNRFYNNQEDCCQSSTSSLSNSAHPHGESKNVSKHNTSARHFYHSHSTESNDDLIHLSKIRQESVPDNLDLYGAKAPSFRKITSPPKNTTPDNTTTTTMQNTSPASPAGMRKIRSMVTLSKNRDRAEALDRFYNFARRLDSYREGIKDHKLSFHSHELGGEFHFIRFETRRMQNAMDLIRANDLHLNIRQMGATGGGAHKFAAKWKEELGIEMVKQDEMDCLVVGMQFVLSTVVGECYTFRPRHSKMNNQKNDSSHASTTSTDNQVDDSLRDREKSTSENQDDLGLRLDNEMGSSSNLETDSNEEDRGKGDDWWWSRKVQRDSISYSSTYPYLVVTIGTGVSFLRVDGPRKYERVSGSTIGGGTYLGLMRLLTDVEDFDDIMRLAERGDPSKVDMLVGDIYGEKSGALEKLGLAAGLVASSFGKLVAKEDPAAGVKQEDLARALLLMITINLGQVAYLNAQLFKTPRIYFVGNFLRQNKLSQQRLAFAIDYWSKSKMEALFLEHEGYFGALGAFLLTQNISVGKENTKPEHRRGKTLDSKSLVG
jgi:type II pantothenate kinase